MSDRSLTPTNPAAPKSSSARSTVTTTTTTAASGGRATRSSRGGGGGGATRVRGQRRLTSTLSSSLMPVRERSDDSRAYIVPRANVFHVPPTHSIKSVAQLTLCPHYDPSASDPAAMFANCPLGDRCTAVHADVRGLQLTQPHRNNAYPSLEAVTYPRYAAGCIFAVKPPNAGKEAIDMIDSNFVLVTQAADPAAILAVATATRGRQKQSVGGADPAATPSDASFVPGGGAETGTPASLAATTPTVIEAQHCAHYYLHRRCMFGAECHFVHAVFIDESSTETVRTPHPRSLGFLPSPEAAAPAHAPPDQRHRQHQQQHRRAPELAHRRFPSDPPMMAPQHQRQRFAASHDSATDTDVAAARSGSMRPAGVEQHVVPPPPAIRRPNQQSPVSTGTPTTAIVTTGLEPSTSGTRPRQHDPYSPRPRPDPSAAAAHASAQNPSADRTGTA